MTNVTAAIRSFTLVLGALTNMLRGRNECSTTLRSRLVHQ